MRSQLVWGSGAGGGATGGPGVCLTQGTLTAELHGQLRPGDIQLQQNLIADKLRRELVAPWLSVFSRLP